MQTLSTTKMSSRGQVVIPEAVRNRLGLETGAQFVVLGDKDVVILKSITRPDMRSFDAMVKRARQQAKISGLRPADITRAIARVRRRT